MEHTADIHELKRLSRSTSDRWLGGVAAGLGRYFDLNPAIYRIGFVVLTLLGGAGILVYLAALLVIPEEDKELSLAAEALARRREKPSLLIGVGLVGVAIAVLLARATLWPVTGAGWVLVLLAGLVVLWMARRPGRSSKIVIAIASLLSLLVAVLAAAVIVMFTWFDVSLGDGVGSRTVRPASPTAIPTDYHLGVGSLTVDLTEIGAIATPTVVHARIGVGELRVIVPPTVPVRVDATAKAGDISALGAHDDGRNSSVHTGSGMLRIEAHIGAGSIDVVRAAG
jgi:phage shock protein PspC (stress-responsive transcriptional regulator)